MKHLICMACVVVLAGFTSGCIMGQAPIWAPISLDLMGSGPVGSGANVKRGESVAKGIVCVAIGDASIETAAKNGGIKKIHHVDTKTTNVLGVYSEYTTIVYGE